MDVVASGEEKEKEVTGSVQYNGGGGNTSGTPGSVIAAE